MGSEVRLRDPAAGDYRPQEGSAAAAYGCQTFALPTPAPPRPARGDNPPAVRVTGAAASAGGLIDQDTLWDAPLVRVTAPVEVAENATLTVAAGTRVEFTGFFGLLVHGRLWAVGAPDRRIVFTAAPEQLTEGWDGIDFLNVPAWRDSSRLEHCLIAGAVARPAAAPDQAKLVGGTHRPETGGAVAIVGVNKLAIVSCEFADNRAQYGGAVYCGYGSSPVLAGNLFTGNTAQWRGSALFSVYAYPKLANNTIVGNACLDESAFALCGAVDNFNGKIILAGNIIRDNLTSHYSGCQVVQTKDFDTRVNNIQNYQGGQGNQDADPVFFGGGAHPFQLTAASPGLDLAPKDGWAGVLGSLDLAGQPRFSGNGLDLGAYEYSGWISPTQEGPPVAEPRLACAPNPFNPRVRLAFELPAAGPVRLTVFDLRGRLVRRLVDGSLPSGSREVWWDGRDDGGCALPSGVYLCRLDSGGAVAVQALTLVR